MSRPSTYFARLRRRKPLKIPAATVREPFRNREPAVSADANDALPGRRWPSQSREPAAEF